MYKIAEHAILGSGIIGVTLRIALLLSDNSAGPNSGIMQALFVPTYILLTIALAAVVFSAAQNILASPEALKKTLIYTGAFILILIVAYMFSSGDVEASASEEAKKVSDSVRKWTSTGLITLYILIAGVIAVLVASNIEKALMR